MRYRFKISEPRILSSSRVLKAACAPACEQAMRLAVDLFPLHASEDAGRKFLLRKEVIQPQVPLRLPCYDFIPVTTHTLGSCPLAVGSLTSGTSNSHDVTGGVYKARERIHGAVADAPLLAIPASCRRVAACNPNWGTFFAICLLSRVCIALYVPLYDVCSPSHKGHEDLTSSPPSSGLTPAVSLESPT